MLMEWSLVTAEGLQIMLMSCTLKGSAPCRMHEQMKFVTLLHDDPLTHINYIYICVCVYIITSGEEWTSCSPVPDGAPGGSRFPVKMEDRCGGKGLDVKWAECSKVKMQRDD